MKKIIATTFICALLIVSVQGQTMSKKEAKKILEKSWNDVINKDSVSFANLWSMNDSISKNQRRPHKIKELYEDYDALRSFLEVALNRNQKIDYIDVDKQNLSGTDTKYWIQAWFKYNDHYSKGFGFYMAFYKGKWVVRDDPSTSSEGRE